jgi:hypothetical protein
MSEPNQLFPTTQWGIVIEAQGTPTPNARQALEQTVSNILVPRLRIHAKPHRASR